MKLPYSWLKEFVPGAPDVAETAKRLSAGGLGIASLRPCTAACDGIVVGEVLSVTSHPKADRLKVCVVEAGGGTFTVVCGAPNVRVGMKAPFAPPGAQLSGGKTVQTKTILGVASQGMLCSAVEVGEGADAEGLLELSGEAVTGEPYVLEADDWVMDIEVTPNRGDALSVVGVARQLAVLLGTPWKLPWAEPAPGSLTQHGADWTVAIEDPAGCGLYTARLLTGVTVAPSPDWMQKRLLACGMRPINSVVDITNYVLLELGQPCHAFDAAKLPSRNITVRRAAPGEVLHTLDGVQRKLSPDVLVIACGPAPVAVAGVMGGASSEIGSGTSSVLLESAWFEPTRVRRAARALGLGSESSYRFERGVDPAGVVRASLRATQLLIELSGAKVASHLLEAKGRLPDQRVIEIRAEDVSETLGVSLSPTQLKEYSKRLGADVSSGKDGLLRVTPPSWRLDLNQPADLVEEFAVLYGYENIPSTMPAREVAHLKATKRETVEALTREALRAAGFSEAQTFSFLSREDLSRLELAHAREDPRGQTVALANPQSEEQELLRTTILPGLLRSAAYNVAREVPAVMLFEMGRVFRDIGAVVETPMLTLLAAGRAAQDAYQAGRPLDFYDLKGALDALTAALGFDLSWEPANENPYALGACAVLTVNGRTLGNAGVLDPTVAAAFDLPAGAVAAELLLDELVNAASLAHPVAAPVRFPAVRRDMAVVVGEAHTAATVSTVIGKAGATLLESAEVFDVYRGKQIPEGTKSLAFRLTFRSAERTLTEQEVDEVMARIVNSLEATLKAKLRTA